MSEIGSTNRLDYINKPFTNVISNTEKNKPLKTDDSNKSYSIENLSLSKNANSSKVKEVYSFADNDPDEWGDFFDNLYEKSEPEQFDMLTSMLAKKGGKIETGSEQRNIIGFRFPTEIDANKKRGHYDDVTAVFWKDKKGEKHVKLFESNTEPTSMFIGDRPNGDFGRIRSGKTYSFGISKTTLGDGQALRPNKELDIDRYDPKEKVFKPASSSFQTEQTFLFHQGMVDNVFSMGCQTFKPKVWDEFMNTIKSDGADGKNQKDIFYTILDVN